MSVRRVSSQPPPTPPRESQSKQPPSSEPAARQQRTPTDAFESAPARSSRNDGAQRGAQTRPSAPAPAADAPQATPPAQQPPPVQVGQSVPAQGTQPAQNVGTGRVPVTLAPRNASEQERFNHYAAIVRANGGEVNPGGRPTVLGIRGMNTDGEQHPTTFRGGRGGYNDTFVVLTADGHVHELRGATHPGQSRSSAAPDVDGSAQRAGIDRETLRNDAQARNRHGDVGMIRPGNYEVVPNGPHAGADSFHVRTSEGSGRIPGWRDTNHSGTLSDAERAASEQRGDNLTEILFHQGGSGPVSIGCQTMPPEEHRRFTQLVGGRRASFNYTLVDANDANAAAAP